MNIWVILWTHGLLGSKVTRPLRGSIRRLLLHLQSCRPVVSLASPWSPCQNPSLTHLTLKSSSFRTLCACAVWKTLLNVTRFHDQSAAILGFSAILGSWQSDIKKGGFVSRLANSRWRVAHWACSFFAAHFIPIWSKPTVKTLKHHGGDSQKRQNLPNTKGAM